MVLPRQLRLPSGDSSGEVMSGCSSSRQGDFPHFKHVACNGWHTLRISSLLRHKSHAKRCQGNVEVGRASMDLFRSSRACHELSRLSGHLAQPAAFAALNKNSIPNTISVVGRKDISSFAARTHSSHHRGTQWAVYEDELQCVHCKADTETDVSRPSAA